MNIFHRVPSVVPAVLRSCLLALSLSAHAEDLWPEFRGGTAQGIATATGLPTEWSADKGIVWKADIAGRAWSSPILAKGKIFLTTAITPADAGPTSLRVLALDAAKGNVVWDNEVLTVADTTSLAMHGKNSQASPTPLFEAGRIYAHFGHHGTACLDEAGKVLWTSTENPYSPVHGTGGSPVLVNDLLIYNAEGKENPVIIALDKATGKTRWKVARASEAMKKFSFCTPLVITVRGQKQIISPGSGVVYALKPEDGSIIWSVRYGQGYSVVPRPVFAHGLIFLSSGFDKPVALAIHPDGKGDVTDSHVAWTFSKNVPRNASMCVIGYELYMLDDGGILSCLDAKTGAVHWQERVLGPCSASLLVGDGHLYAADEKGTTVVVQPGKTFKLLATNNLNEKTLATPAVCGSDLLIRTESRLYRVAKR